jgi:hypothetical protein
MNSRSEQQYGLARWPMRVSALSACCLMALLFACNQPADLDRARTLIDSARTLERIDSLRKTVLNDSLSDGRHTYRDKDGRPVMEGEWLNGNRIGTWTSYHGNGRVKSRSTYANGELNGPTAVFYENGSPYYSGSDRNGHPVGEWNFFDAKGGLVKTVSYDSAGAVINDR